MITAVIIILLVCFSGWAVYNVVLRSRKGGGCCGVHEASVRRIPVQDRNKENYPYKAVMSIGGMTCENCAVRVENALNQLPGTWAKVDISENRAVVLMKSEPDEQIVRDAVRLAGYVVMDFEYNS